MNKKTRAYLWRLSFSLLLLLFLFRMVRFEEALELFKGMQGPALAGYLVILFGDRMIMAYKWRFLLEAKGIFLPFKELAAVYFKGTLVGNLLPTSLGGDIIRAYELARNDSALKDVVASIAMERFLGFLSSALMALMVLPLLSLLGPDIPRSLSWALVAFFLVGLFSFYIFMTKLESAGFRTILQKLPASDKILSLVSSWSLYKAHPQALWRFFFWSFGEQLLPILSIYLLGLSLGLPLPWFVYLTVIPITQFFARIPVSLSGFGIQEGLFMTFFSFFGLASTSAFTLGFASNLGAILSGLPGVFFYLKKR